MAKSNVLLKSYMSKVGFPCTFLLLNLKQFASIESIERQKMHKKKFKIITKCSFLAISEDLVFKSSLGLTNNF